LLLAPVSGGELWKNIPATRPADLGDKRAILDEYGLVSAEEADIGPDQATAYRFKDPTGAVAASLWLPGTLQGNYLITCTCNNPAKIVASASPFPGQTKGPLPPLFDYFPQAGRVQRSARYLLGPASLAAFAPQLPQNLFGLQYSPEGEVAKYQGTNAQGKTREDTLIVIAYPTPQMAREQALAMETAKLGLIKRSGPLLALIPAPSDAVAASKLLRQVSYRASVQWNEFVPVPVKAQSVGQMILAIFSLAGIVLVFCVLSGLAFGGIRIFRRKFGNADANDAMIVLNLQSK
jgi:hypothetical protein